VAAYQSKTNTNGALRYTHWLYMSTIRKDSLQRPAFRLVGKSIFGRLDGLFEIGSPVAPAEAIELMDVRYVDLGSPNGKATSGQ
jgi:hypothetical protein